MPKFAFEHIKGRLCLLIYILVTLEMDNSNSERPALVHTMMTWGGVVPDQICTSTRCEKNSSKIKKNNLCIVLIKGCVAREQIDPHPALEGALNCKFV